VVRVRLEDWRDWLEAVVKDQAQRSGDGSHDVGHCRRVWQVVQTIASELDEPVDSLVLLAAAYLHDAVTFEKDDPRRSQASRHAACWASARLAEEGFPADKLDAVSHAIEAHSWSAGIKPETREAQILQDADRMDALGAIGLARLFYVSGRMGGRLFDEADPLARHRDLDDRAYALDHFHTKILRLPGMMNTAPGRAIAQARVRLVEGYLEALVAEIETGLPPG